jgi:hypothetical protein
MAARDTYRQKVCEGGKKGWEEREKNLLAHKNETHFWQGQGGKSFLCRRNLDIQICEVLVQNAGRCDEARKSLA